MSLDDVAPFKSKKNSEAKGAIFGIVAGAFAGLAALFGISMLLKHHPDNNQDKAVEAAATLQDPSETLASGVSNVELL